MFSLSLVHCLLHVPLGRFTRLVGLLQLLLQLFVGAEAVAKLVHEVRLHFTVPLIYVFQI